MSGSPDEPSTRYAAKLLRGVTRRIDDLESAVSDQGVPNLLRSVSERAGLNDSVSVTEHDGGTFIADQSTADGTDLTG